jgi:hypothetical protein
LRKTGVNDELKCLVANRFGSVRRQLDLGVEHRGAKMVQKLIQTTIEATASRNLQYIQYFPTRNACRALDK